MLRTSKRDERILYLQTRLAFFYKLLVQHKNELLTGPPIPRSTSKLLNMIVSCQRELDYMLTKSTRYDRVPRENVISKKSSSVFDSICMRDLHDLEYLSNDAFSKQYVLTRSEFAGLLHMIRVHDVFQSYGGGRRQAKVEHQLMVFLSYLRADGLGGSTENAAAYFKVGSGTLESYRNRVLRAIEEVLGDSFLSWPDEFERKHIAQLFCCREDAMQVVGVVNTLVIPLATRPRCGNPQDWKEGPVRRLPTYSLVCAMVCDHKMHIRYCSTVKPAGTTSDDQLLGTTDMAQKTNELFTPGECLSVQGCSEYPVASFSPREWLRAETIPYEVMFSVTMDSLKKRFSFLNSIRLTWRDDAVVKMESYIKVAAILHNYLLTVGGDSPENIEV